MESNELTRDIWALFCNRNDDDEGNDVLISVCVWDEVFGDDVFRDDVFRDDDDVLISVCVWDEVFGDDVLIRVCVCVFGDNVLFRDLDEIFRWDNDAAVLSICCCCWDEDCSQDGDCDDSLEEYLFFLFFGSSNSYCHFIRKNLLLNNIK